MATQRLGVDGLSVEARTFYEKTLLSRRVPDFYYDKFGLEKDIPRGWGRSIDFRRFERPAAATTALTEGTPPSVTNPTVANVQATVNQYGAYMLGSDVLETQAIDPVITGFTEAFAEQAQDTRDQIVRDTIIAGTNIQYAADATTRATVGSGDDLTYAELREARATLRRNNARPLKKGPAAGRFAAIIHPDTTTDLLADTNVVNILKDAANRGDNNPLITGMIGDIIGFRFFETSNATIYSSAGLSGADVYGTLMIADEAYGVSKYSGQTVEVIFHPKGSSGVNDPLNQVWSLGWKMALAVVRLDENRLLRIEHNTSRKRAA